MSSTRTARGLAAITADLSTLADDTAATLTEHAAALAILRSAPGDDAADVGQVAALLAMVAVTEGETDHGQAVRFAVRRALQWHRADAADDESLAAGDSTDLADLAGDPADSLWSPRQVAPDTITRTTAADVRAETVARLDRPTLDTLAACWQAVSQPGYLSADGLPSAARVGAVLGLKRGRATTRLAAAITDAADLAAETMTAVRSAHRSAAEPNTADRIARPIGGRPITLAAASTHRSGHTTATDLADAASKRDHGGSARPVTTAATASLIVRTLADGRPVLDLADRSILLTAEQAADLLARTDALAPYAATDGDRTADQVALDLAPAGAVLKPQTGRRKRNGGSVGTSVVLTRSRRRWSETSVPAARLA